MSQPVVRILHRTALAAASLTILSLSLLSPVGGAAAASPTGTIAPPAEILSNYEVSTGHRLDRDCGYSAPVLNPYGGNGLPHIGVSQDLWLFCDTVDYDASGAEDGAILGADTAAEAPLVPGRVPQDLSELPTPPARAGLPEANPPQPFLPVPSGLTLPGSTSACVGASPSPNGVYGPASPGIYPASWIAGAERQPVGFGTNPLDVLVTFSNYCVDAETGNINTLFTDEGFGLVSYDPLDNRLTTPAYVFTSSGGQNLPPQEQLGDPIFYGGYLYLFSSQCLASIFGVCTSGQVFMARTPAVPRLWDDGASYQWWTGAGWSSSYDQAGNLVPAATPFGLSTGDFRTTGHGLVLVAESDVAGGFQVFTSPSPTGPWQLSQTGRIPNSGDCNAGEFGCYALVAHSELSTSSDFMLSYFDPAGLGHLYLAAFPWSS